MRKIIIVIGALLIFLVLPLRAEVLINKREASLPDAENENSRGISRGPGVKIVSPHKGGAVNSPFYFKVIFEPHGGATIEPSSVRMFYLKRPVVDLSERIQGKVTKDGIDFPRAEVPLGEHHLQVSVMDSNGHTANVDFTVEIVK